MKIKNPNRANKYKNKHSCCGMCKPHKRGWEHRFKNKDKIKIKGDRDD